jgi:hypothetical protein
VTGTLFQVDMQLAGSGPGGQACFGVALESTTADGHPDAVIAGLNAPRCIPATGPQRVSIPLAAPVMAGTRYALAVQVGASDTHISWLGSAADSYPRGSAWQFGILVHPSPMPVSGDAAFVTYVFVP